MTKNEIRGGLIARGYDYNRIASKMGVSREAVGRVVAHGMTSTRIMIRIAEILDLPPQKVFPEAAHLFNPPIVPQSEAA